MNLDVAEAADEACWDAQKLCAVLGVSRSWVYAEVDARRLPHFRLRKGATRSGIRFRPSDIRKWMQQRVDGEVEK